VGNGKYALESMAWTVNTVLSGTGGFKKLCYPEMTYKLILLKMILE
jgi:hypothetical protein